METTSKTKKAQRRVAGSLDALVRPLRVNLDGREGEVERSEYVKAKTSQLREFGYGDLTEEHVNEQIDALLAGKTFGKGLTAIGKFMEKEIVV